MPKAIDSEPRTIFQVAVLAWLAGALVFALAAVAWLALPALLLAFAAVVFAVMLNGLATLLERRLRAGRAAALAIAGVAVLALPLLGGLLIGPELKHQLRQVVEALPAAVDAVEKRLDIDLTAVLKSTAFGHGGDPKADVSGTLSGLLGVARSLLSQLRLAGSVVVSAIAGAVIVVVGGFYLATDPARYRRGAVMLFPKDQQERVETALGNCGAALHLWLQAQLVSMVAVGVLTGCGAWIIGLPAPLAIGFLAGVLEFIPILGPWLGAVPVLLLAAGLVGPFTV